MKPLDYEEGGTAVQDVRKNDTNRDRRQSLRNNRFTKSFVKRTIQLLSVNRIMFSVPGSKCIALTFDDGPVAENTTKILGILRQFQIKTSFFINGKNAEKHPDLVRAMHEEGHTVGNHGYNHYHLEDYKGNLVSYFDNIRRAEEIIASITGKRSFLYRPPYGNMDLSIFLPICKMGYRIVFWNFDSNDSFIKNPALLASTIISAAPGPGSIILMHEDYNHTLQALPEILAGLRRKKVRFCSL